MVQVAPTLLIAFAITGRNFTHVGAIGDWFVVIWVLGALSLLVSFMAAVLGSLEPGIGRIALVISLSTAVVSMSLLATTEIASYPTVVRSSPRERIMFRIILTLFVALILAGVYSVALIIAVVIVF